MNVLCAGNKVFATRQAQGGGVTPTPLAYALGLKHAVRESHVARDAFWELSKHLSYFVYSPV